MTTNNTNDQAPPVDFTGSKAWVPYEGDPVDFVPFEGYASARVTKCVPQKAKNSSNWNMKINLVLEDEDCKGMRLIRYQPYTGTRDDGRQNMDGFREFLLSTGTDLEKIQALEGKQLSADEICKQVTGRVCFPSIGAGEYEGKPRSEVKGFIPKKKFEEEKAIGAHRRPVPEQYRTSAPAAGASQNGKANLSSEAQQQAASVL
jgi:hypothetical protein